MSAHHGPSHAPSHGHAPKKSSHASSSGWKGSPEIEGAFWGLIGLGLWLVSIFVQRILGGNH